MDRDDGGINLSFSFFALGPSPTQESEWDAKDVAGSTVEVVCTVVGIRRSRRSRSREYLEETFAISSPKPHDFQIRKYSTFSYTVAFKRVRKCVPSAVTVTSSHCVGGRRECLQRAFFVLCKSEEGYDKQINPPLSMRPFFG